jgi:hypothetical protein
MPTLEEENRQILNLLQALLGAVLPTFRAVSITCRESILLTFLLSEDSQEAREEIEDIEFEFFALQTGPILVSTEVIISSISIADVRLPGRLVFLRREESA